MHTCQCNTELQMELEGIELKELSRNPSQKAGTSMSTTMQHVLIARLQGVVQIEGQALALGHDAHKLHVLGGGDARVLHGVAVVRTALGENEGRKVLPVLFHRDALRLVAGLADLTGQ